MLEEKLFSERHPCFFLPHHLTEKRMNTSGFPPFPQPSPEYEQDIPLSLFPSSNPSPSSFLPINESAQQLPSPQGQLFSTPPMQAPLPSVNTAVTSAFYLAMQQQYEQEQQQQQFMTSEPEQSDTTKPEKPLPPPVRIKPFIEQLGDVRGEKATDCG